jgi:hypothetical protein
MLKRYLLLSKRKTKLEILPTARVKMLDAHGWLSHLANRLQQHPDLNSFHEAQLREWVKQLNFTDFQNDELLNSEDKNKYFKETQFWYDDAKALAIWMIFTTIFFTTHLLLILNFY